MRPRRAALRLAWAAAILLAGAAGAAVAQVEDAPPDRVPAGANLGSVGMAFPGGSVALASAGSVSLSSGSVAFRSGPVAASAAGVASPGGRVAAPGGRVAAPAGRVAAPATAIPAGAVSMKEETGGALRFTLNADLLFDFDKASLRPEADPALSQLVTQAGARMPTGRFRIEGHTDAKGTDAYNDALSTRRAKSVQAWLVKKGRVPAGRISTAGLGKRRPVAPNERKDGSDDPEGRQKNRRVEILVQPGAEPVKPRTGSSEAAPTDRPGSARAAGPRPGR